MGSAVAATYITSLRPRLKLIFDQFYLPKSSKTTHQNA